MKSAISTSIVVLIAACGTQKNPRVEKLRESLEALRGQVQRMDDQVENLSHRLFVITDRVESASESSADRAGNLKVVTLKPRKLAPAKNENIAEAEHNSGPAVEISMDDNGRLVAHKPGARAPKRRPSNGKTFELALTAFRRGDHQQACSGFEKVLGTARTQADKQSARFWIGECRFEAGNYGDALQAFGIFAREYPNSQKVPDALLKMGISHERLGQPTQAAKVFRQLIDKAPKSPLAELAASRLHKAGAP